MGKNADQMIEPKIKASAISLIALYQANIIISSPFFFIDSIGVKL